MSKLVQWNFFNFFSAKRKLFKLFHDNSPYREEYIRCPLIQERCEMPRARRRIISGKCYELCFRAKSSLPFVPYKVIAFLLSAILARVQRDFKLTLCHDIWNGSHAHIIIVAKNAEQCVRFYMEVQKKITDALKRLLGIDYLTLWEGRPMVAEIGDLAAAKERIAYLYANPAQDNLVDCIEQFPGYSSWSIFKQCYNSLAAKDTKSFPWVRLPSIRAASSPILSDSEDKALVRLLKMKNKAQFHELIREPNAWMECFGIDSDEEAAKINEDIVEEIQANEAEARKNRADEKKNLMGLSKLCSQPILKEHAPKKRGRKIFIITTIKEIRIRVILEFREFCNLCRNCYEQCIAGKTLVSWPLEAFRPPLPPIIDYHSTEAGVMLTSLGSP